MQEWEYPVEDPFDAPPPAKKKPRPKPRRCKKCRTFIEPDGYGTWVHSGTEEYPAAWYGCPTRDENGYTYHEFIKPKDPRFADVATP